jgi:hypothetical protein
MVQGRQQSAWYLLQRVLPIHFLPRVCWPSCPKPQSGDNQISDDWIISDMSGVSSTLRVSRPSSLLVHFSGLEYRRVCCSENPQPREIFLFFQWPPTIFQRHHPASWVGPSGWILRGQVRGQLAPPYRELGGAFRVTPLAHGQLGQSDSPTDL